MRVFDELREALCDIHAGQAVFLNARGELDPLGHDYIPEFDVREVIDRIESAHPGLEDNTQECHKCHGRFKRSDLHTVVSRWRCATMQTEFCTKCRDETDMSEYYGREVTVI